MKRLAMILAAAATLLASGGLLHADEWTVNPGESIQAAIDGAAPGDTIIISQGSYYHTSVLTIPKSLTIRGASGASQPTLQFSDGAYDGVQIQADDVTIENLRIYRDGHSSYNSLLSVPKGGGYPNYTVEYERITIQDSTFEGGRYGLYAAPGDLTVQGNTFQDNYRDSIILIGGNGTNTISGNHFTGGAGSKKAILIEPASGEPPISGTLNVEYNTVAGKRNFLVFNHWNHPDTDQLALNVVHNSVWGTASSALGFYAAYTDDPDGFDKFIGINIADNIFSEAGLAAYVDYEDWGGAPPADSRAVAPNGFIDVINNVAYGNTAGANDTTDPTGNYGYLDLAGMTPSGASMNMFGLLDNIVGDPKFVDPGNGDLRLLAGSPALNTASDGTNIGAYQGPDVPDPAAIPEPATMGLLAMGGLGVLVRRRRSFSGFFH